ncbi:MAG: hypothetical protein KGL04_05360, partial [Elusimicrobia bacterium]|nr:hypothetical protein [Elusimicrobiota bacterium]
GGVAPFLAKAPPISIPMRHFVFAACAFWIFAAAFAFGSDRFLGFNFQAMWVLGLVHTLTLGWITMSILGAMCQLAPVLWEVSLPHPRLVKFAWWCFAVGATGMVGHLWAGLQNFWMPAALAVLGAFLYLFVFWKAMARARKLDWTGKHLALSLGYLSAVVVLGLLLAYDRERGILFSDPQGVLIAHIHLALIGWVSLTIMGVSYRLVSMFTLAHLDSKTPGRLALALVNVGLIGLAADALFFGRRGLQWWALILVLGGAAYLYQMRRIFAARNRRIDPALAFTLLALCGGAVWAALGLGLAFGWIRDGEGARAAYVFAAVLGWATPYILGQIHKIVPFLVWLHLYSPPNRFPAGVAPPKMQDLTSEKLAWLELAALAPGICVGIAAFLAQSEPLIRTSAWFLLVAATVYLINTGLTLKHLRWSPYRG